MYYSDKYRLYKAACGVYRVRTGARLEKQAANIKTTMESIYETVPWLWNRVRSMFGGKPAVVAHPRLSPDDLRTAERLESEIESLGNTIHYFETNIKNSKTGLSQSDLAEIEVWKKEKARLTKQLKELRSDDLFAEGVDAAKIDRINSINNPTRPAVPRQSQVAPRSAAASATKQTGSSSQQSFGPEVENPSGPSWSDNMASLRKTFNRWSDRLDQFNEKHPYIARAGDLALYSGLTGAGAVPGAIAYDTFRIDLENYKCLMRRYDDLTRRVEDAKRQTEEFNRQTEECNRQTEEFKRQPVRQEIKDDVKRRVEDEKRQIEVLKGQIEAADIQAKDLYRQREAVARRVTDVNSQIEVLKRQIEAVSRVKDVKRPREVLETQHLGTSEMPTPDYLASSQDFPTPAIPPELAALSTSSTRTPRPAQSSLLPQYSLPTLNKLPSIDDALTQAAQATSSPRPAQSSLLPQHSLPAPDYLASSQDFPTPAIPPELAALSATQSKLPAPSARVASSTKTPRPASYGLLPKYTLPTLDKLPSQYDLLAQPIQATSSVASSQQKPSTTASGGNVSTATTTNNKGFDFNSVKWPLLVGGGSLALLATAALLARRRKRKKNSDEE